MINLFELAEVGLPLGDFLTLVRREDPEDVILALRYANRFADIRFLQTDDVYGEHAKFELDLRDTLLAFQAMDDQRVAKMLSDYPELKILYATCQQIWWHCDIMYPHKSENMQYAIADEYLLCITGDGMGMAYFEVETLKEKGKIELVKVVDDKLRAVFQRVDILAGKPTTLTKLEVAMSLFRRKTNEKHEALR